MGEIVFSLRVEVSKYGTSKNRSSRQLKWDLAVRTPRVPQDGETIVGKNLAGFWGHKGHCCRQ